MRVVGRRPKVLGLTGSIAMGKSEAARIFRRLRIPVFDADAEVHRLMAPGGRGVDPVAAAFPGVLVEGRIDRQILGAAVFDDTPALQRLEAILHPLVGRARSAFLRRARALGAAVVVLDIPLLFETGGEARVDLVAVVSAPPFVQRRRALRRPGMTPEKFASIVARQVPDREKRRRADFVIPSGLGRRPTLRSIRRLLTLVSDSAKGGPGA